MPLLTEISSLLFDFSSDKWRFLLFVDLPSYESRHWAKCVQSVFSHQAIPDEMSPEEILAQARSAASRAKLNLDSAKKKVRVGFLRKKEKGEIAFAVTEEKSQSHRDDFEDEKPNLHIAAKSSASSAGLIHLGKDAPAEEDAFDLFNNKNRFVKELPAILKPVEKPVDKVSHPF